VNSLHRNGKPEHDGIPTLPPPQSVLRGFRGALERLGAALLGGALVRLFWLFEATLDVRVWGMEHVRLCRRGGERPLVVLWHGKGFVPIAHFHEERLCLYASHARDPNYSPLLRRLRSLTLYMIERMGYEVMDATQFASESRGVLKYVQNLREGAGGAIAADGPLGPIYQAKPGACFLAKKAGVTLIPVGSAIERGFRLDNWDRFEIPLPFSRAAIAVEECIEVPSDADDALLEQKRVELETALNRATNRAAQKLGLTSVPATTDKQILAG